MKSKPNQFAFALKATVSFLVLTLCSVSMFLVAVVTLFQCRSLYSEKIAAPLGHVFLRIWGIRMVVHELTTPVNGQVVYISNHTSAIDVFALVALGLPNTRFFLSGYLRKLLPMGLIGYLIGIFWTVPQEYPEKRTRIFKRAAQILKRTGESVYLSPEGMRVTDGQIGHFNKGAFHLASDLAAPIVPMFIHVPEGVDPGSGLNAGKGEVHVHFREPIPTKGWKIEELLSNKDAVRDLYKAWHVDLIGQQNG